MQGIGSQVDLRAWYNDNQTTLRHATFLCGSSEELVLVDDAGHMRIYSLTTQSFRYVALVLRTLIPLTLSQDQHHYIYRDCHSVFTHLLMVLASSLRSLSMMSFTSEHIIGPTLEVHLASILSFKRCQRILLS